MGGLLLPSSHSSSLAPVVVAVDERGVRVASEGARGVGCARRRASRTAPERQKIRRSPSRAREEPRAVRRRRRASLGGEGAVREKDGGKSGLMTRPVGGVDFWKGKGWVF